MKCECGVELFDCDVVHKIYNITEGGVFDEKEKIYRCPKCFKVKPNKEKQ